MLTEAQRREVGEELRQAEIKVAFQQVRAASAILHLEFDMDRELLHPTARRTLEYWASRNRDVLMELRLLDFPDPTSELSEESLIPQVLDAYVHLQGVLQIEYRTDYGHNPAF